MAPFTARPAGPASCIPHPGCCDCASTILAARRGYSQSVLRTLPASGAAMTDNHIRSTVTRHPPVAMPTSRNRASPTFHCLPHASRLPPLAPAVPHSTVTVDGAGSAALHPPNPCLLPHLCAATGDGRRLFCLEAEISSLASASGEGFSALDVCRRSVSAPTHFPAHRATCIRSLLSGLFRAQLFYLSSFSLACLLHPHRASLPLRCWIHLPAARRQRCRRIGELAARPRPHSPCSMLHLLLRLPHHPSS